MTAPLTDHLHICGALDGYVLRLGDLVITPRPFRTVSNAVRAYGRVKEALSQLSDALGPEYQEEAA